MAVSWLELLFICTHQVVFFIAFYRTHMFLPRYWFMIVIQSFAMKLIAIATSCLANYNM